LALAAIGVEDIIYRHRAHPPALVVTIPTERYRAILSSRSPPATLRSNPHDTYET